MRVLFTIIIVFRLIQLSAQAGCTDPQAINFDENATANDGSCSYDPTDYTLTQLTLLPESLLESSGLEFFNSRLWIHNDAGNEDKIYRIDSLNGQILQSVIVAGADNIDWEDLAENDEYLFLGDIGNNPGNRTNLAIYRIPKNSLNAVSVAIEKIEFEYSDQTDFSENPNNHDFDCEAIMFYNDSLHLFTKNWVDNETRHYVLPNEPGEHIAQLRESLNVGVLITSADINEQGVIVLLGYTELGYNFLWLLFDFEGSQFFSGNKRKISLGHGSQNSQTEGISFRESGYGYICSEEFKITDDIILPQKLLAFSIDQWINPITSIAESPFRNGINILPNPFTRYLEIENFSEKEIHWQLFDNKGRFLSSGFSSDQHVRISASALISGIYFLSIFIEGKAHTYKLVKT